MSHEARGSSILSVGHQCNAMLAKCNNATQLEIRQRFPAIRVSMLSVNVIADAEHHRPLVVNAPFVLFL